MAGLTIPDAVEHVGTVRGEEERVSSISSPRKPRTKSKNSNARNRRVVSVASDGDVAKVADERVGEGVAHGVCASIRHE